MADNNDEANTIKLSDSVGKANPVTFSLDQKPPTKQKLKLKKSISVRFQQETFAKKTNDIKESIPERVRSNSHMSFQCRPEFVPKPRPKPTKVNPSPMKLCKKNFLSRHKSNDMCKDVPETDEVLDDSLSLSGDNNSLVLDDDDNDNEEKDNEVTNVAKIRKELNLDEEDNNKKNPCVDDDYDNILNIDALVQAGGKKKKSRSVWRKHIQKQDEERNWLHNSYCPEEENSLKIRKTVSGGNFSIIKILESAANEKKSLHQSNFY